MLGLDKKAFKDFRAIDGAAVQLSGAQLLALAGDKHITAITPDARVRLSAASGNGNGNGKAKWPFVTGVDKYPTTARPLKRRATIAIVDSGVDTNRCRFGCGVKRRRQHLHHRPTRPVTVAVTGRSSPVSPPATRRQRRHLSDRPDVSYRRARRPGGWRLTSDVIAACDWILHNKAQYNIKVANFSLHSTVASFFCDPLDKAVEKLWFDGVVVVTAAGNYGDPTHPAACRSPRATTPS